jgi:aspartyl/asparaginyl-tRNA synthetase
MLPIKIACFSLNFRDINEKTLGYLDGAFLPNSIENVNKFKEKIGIKIEELAIINKCNAVIILITYNVNISTECLRGRVLDTWDGLSKNGITDFIRHIEYKDGEEAIKYLGRCALGIYSVTPGDTQVASQICGAIHFDHEIQKESPTLFIITTWLKDLVSEVKLKTKTFEGNTSIERIACSVIDRELETKDKIITVIGTGKSGELVIKILSGELGYKVKIANRTIEKAKKIENKYNISIIDFLNYSEITNSDAIILAIDSNDETKKYFHDLSRSIKGSKLKLIIDIASPPIIKENSQPNIKIINIKNLSEESKVTIQTRMMENGKANQIIDKLYPNIVDSLNKEIGKININRQKTLVKCKLDYNKLELFKIRDNIFYGIREFLRELDFIEINTPYIVGISTDPPKVDRGGTINISWPDGSPAFLRQSNQLYKQIVVTSGLSKIFEIGPFWRSETIQSYRHLQESMALDVEIRNVEELSKLYKLAYSIIVEAQKRLVDFKPKKYKKLLLPDLRSLPIITYEKSIELLNVKGYSIAYGEDLGLTGEAKLGQIIRADYKSDIFVIKNYPDTIKKFYTKKIDGGLTETFDIILCGWELVSGALRETNRENIEKSMKLSGLKIDDYNFYLSIVDNSVPHGGFGMGLDRLIAKLLNLEVITDAVVFPRTFKTLIP